MKKRFLKRMFSLALALVMIAGLTGCASPEGQYDNANKLLINGEYSEAAEAFASLGGFQDASQMTRYCRALAAAESGDYDTAVRTFASMEQFKDCYLLAPYYSARQQEALGVSETDPAKWYEAEGWIHCSEAVALYSGLPMFLDSDTRAAGCLELMYSNAQALADAGDYQAAAAVMTALGDYSDAENRAVYYTACLYEQNCDYPSAYSAFTGLDGFMDSPSRAKAVLATVYHTADTDKSAGKYDTAYQQFTWLAETAGDYSHENGAPAEQAKECARLQGEAMLAKETPDYAAAREWFALCGDYAPVDNPSAADHILQSWYLEGESLLNADEPDFAAVRAAFTNAGEYAPEGGASSAECILQSWYLEGESLMNADEPDFAAARAAFTNAGEYAPEGGASPAECILRCWYLEGESLMNTDEPDFEAARAAFTNAGEYAPVGGASSAECILQSWYLEGESLLNADEPDFAAARAAFTNAEEYAPEGGASPAECILRCWYLEGERLMNADEPDYAAARDAFTNAGEYQDAATRFSELCYLKGVEYSFGENPNYYAAILAFINAGDYEDSVSQRKSCQSSLLQVASVGDHVFFGNYEQDNNTENGQEPIEWLVLDKQGDRLLVISRYALDCQQYHNKWVYTTWANCTLRKWLNRTFLNTAFSEKEQEHIPTVTVNVLRNPEFGTHPGNKSQDTIFLLNIQEVQLYFPETEARVCQPTAYAAAQGAWHHKNGACWWWLRSPGYIPNRAAFIHYGGFNYIGLDVTYENAAVRPALWIDLNP
ncbi:MAG: hypothetical protein E7331_05730 [Clostridiales bacterium]|nr:hypothetical protein [Clostridiales bacterium]